jgi:hypothetical protein
MRKIARQEIGEIFYRLYESEINFRFENFWDGGYTWAVIGYEGEPEPGEIRWTRIEIDNALDKFIMFPSEEIYLSSIHFMKKDWLKRGTEKEIETAVIALWEASCRVYPTSDFAQWFLHKAQPQKDSA